MNPTPDPVLPPTAAVPPIQPISPGDDPPLTWAETRALIRSDFVRTVNYIEAGASLSHRVYFFFLPGTQVMFWHRLARYAYLRHWRMTARVIGLFALYLTRAEIPPTTSIGPSALVSHATNVHLFGRIGARFTIQGDGGCGGGFGIDDIGGGPGYPVVGDDVTLAFGAKVLGAVRLGDGVRVGPCALVTADVPANALVLWPKPRVILGGATPSDASTTAS